MSSVIKKHKRKTESYLASYKGEQNIMQDIMSSMANPVFDTYHLCETTRLEEFTAQKEAKPFFDALIKVLGLAFKRERNQNNQAQHYRLILIKLFSHDAELLKKAAKELGFWFKDAGNGKILLAWTLSKSDIQRYKAE